MINIDPIIGFVQAVVVALITGIFMLKSQDKKQAVKDAERQARSEQSRAERELKEDARFEKIENKIDENQRFTDERIRHFSNEVKGSIEVLEKKQDKHNGLIERMVVVEQSTKSAHHRIDQAIGKEVR